MQLSGEIATEVEAKRTAIGVHMDTFRGNSSARRRDSVRDPDVVGQGGTAAVDGRVGAGWRKKRKKEDE